MQFSFGGMMRMNVWPRSGQPKRIYLNTGGKWSVDTWLEPAIGRPDWTLQIRLKDAEAASRRVELYAEIESFMHDQLSGLLRQHGQALPMTNTGWSNWVELAVCTGRKNNYK